MNDEKRRDDGMTQRRKVLGDAWVDKSLANITPFNKEFQEFITRTAWGDIWTRPGLDRRMRSVGVLSTTIAHTQIEAIKSPIITSLTIQ